MTTWYGKSVIEQVYNIITNTLESNIPSIIKFPVVLLCGQLPWKFPVFIYLFLPENFCQSM
jgi:hypothetical protein